MSNARKTLRATAVVCVTVLSALASAGSVAADKAERDAPATLRALNRDVITMRATLAGVTPAMRVERASERMRSIRASSMGEKLRTEPVQLGSARGVQIMLGDQLLFAVFEDDVDPTSNQTHAALVKQTLANLEEVRTAWEATRRWPLVLDGMVRAGVATGILVALAFLMLRGFSGGIAWLERRRDLLAARRERVTLREFIARFTVRLAQFIKWLVLLAFMYAWATYVLERFPLTEPIGLRLGNFIVNTLTWLGEGVLSGLPGLFTMIVVLAVTRAVVDLVVYFLESVQNGRISVGFLHPETIGATRRIVTVAVWCLGFAIAYPFIPGSDSDVFKGLSVLIGLMLSLGSTGLVTQAMSGLVVVYSRALKRGDFVRVNDIEGVVAEVATLATKIVNVRNEEITIPNSVLVSNPIHNYSKLAGSQGTLLTSKVTIGYDAPWRQVHALLVAAAERTPGVRRDPKPYVYQRSLSDFYVEYEVFVHVDRAADRVPVLSGLHANIQDEFNEHGVQIMSPHFLGQPDQPVVVPKAGWFRAPAARASSAS